MSKISIIEVMGGYRIKEIVTTDGIYITWPGLYRKKETAQKEIDALLRRRK